MADEARAKRRSGQNQANRCDVRFWAPQAGSRARLPIAGNLILNADVAELADALDLGSSVPDVKVQVLSSAPKMKTPR